MTAIPGFVVVTALVGCGEPHSAVSGVIDVDPAVDRTQFVTLEIRVVAYDDDQPDARAHPDEPSPFADTVALEEITFPFEYELVEGAFYEWSKGWAVAWLSGRDDAEWVLGSEPFGAKRIELVEPGTKLAPTARDADVLIRPPQ